MLASLLFLFLSVFTSTAFADPFEEADCSSGNWTDFEIRFQWDGYAKSYTNPVHSNCTELTSALWGNQVCDDCNFQGTASFGGGGTNMDFKQELQLTTCDTLNPGTTFAAGYHYSPSFFCDIRYHIQYDLVTGYNDSIWDGYTGNIGEIERNGLYYCTIANTPASCTLVSIPWQTYSLSWISSTPGNFAGGMEIYDGPDKGLEGAWDCYNH